MRFFKMKKCIVFKFTDHEPKHFVIFVQIPHLTMWKRSLKSLQNISCESSNSKHMLKDLT